MWKRYRFKTESVDNPRPLIFNPKYPWWCTGEAGDGGYATIVAYLPANEDLLRYWDEASDVELTTEKSNGNIIKHIKGAICRINS